MDVIEIIKQFYSYGQENGFRKLQEGKVVRPSGSETIFNMSAISEHISLFDMLSETGCVEKYVTKQLSYFSNKLDGVGINRLTNPMEVGLSFLVKNCKEPEEMIYHALAFLQSIGLFTHRIYVRCDKELEFRRWYIKTGIPSENIYEWKNIEKFHIGKQRPTGNYSYLYYKYLNGVVPFGTIATIYRDGHYHFDVVFYAERLAMILEEKESIWGISEINFLLPVVSSFPINFLNVNRFVLLFRVLVLLIHGGIGEISNKKQGYFLKKIIRELAFLLDSKTISNLSKKKIVDLSSNLVHSLGYTDLNIQQKRQLEESIEKINYFSIDIAKRLNKVENMLRNQEVNSIDFKKLKGEYGIFPEWIVAKYSDILKDRGIHIETKKRNSIRSLALGNDNRVVDIDELLREKNV